MTKEEAVFFIEWCLHRNIQSISFDGLSVLFGPKPMQYNKLEEPLNLDLIKENLDHPTEEDLFGSDNQGDL